MIGYACFCCYSCSFSSSSFSHCLSTMDHLLVRHTTSAFFLSHTHTYTQTRTHTQSNGPSIVRSMGTTNSKFIKSDRRCCRVNFVVLSLAFYGQILSCWHLRGQFHPVWNLVVHLLPLSCNTTPQAQVADLAEEIM